MVGFTKKYAMGWKKSLYRAKRSVRKLRRKVGQGISTRYYGKKTGLNTYRMAKDLALLKNVINVEKKSVSFNVNAIPVGQVIGNLDGYFAYDVTPVLTQGAMSNQRTGNSIKLVSFHMQMQFVQQAAASQKINFKMYIIQQLGMPITSGTIVPQVWSTNNFVGGGGAIIDYNSQLVVNNFAQHKILYSKKFSVQPDAFTGQVGFKTVECGLKYNHHVRYFESSTTPCANGQIWMVLLADSGNCSGTVASTQTNIPTGAVNTGCLVNVHLRHYFVDN